jgi:hypothetical protein
MAWQRLEANSLLLGSSNQQAGGGRRPTQGRQGAACTNARTQFDRAPSVAGAIQGRLNLLHCGADEAVDRGHRLGVQLRRRQAAHQDLECHCHQRPAAGRGG